MDVLDPVFLFVVVKFSSNGILFTVDGVLKGIAPVAVSFNRFHNAITFKLLFYKRIRITWMIEFAVYILRPQRSA